MPETNKLGKPDRTTNPQESASHALKQRLALVKLMDEWMHGDEAEQRETFEILSRSIDEGRAQGYKLFS